MQAEERKRIAREVRDSTSQQLVVLQLQLSTLKRFKHPGAEALIEECERAIDELQQRIRSID